MAIVPNKNGLGIPGNGMVDPSYCVPSVVGATVPTAAAAYANQIGLNTTTGILYMATTAGGTTWIEKK